MKKIKAKQFIRLEIAGKEVELSEEEARDLKNQLDRIFPAPAQWIYEHGPLEIKTHPERNDWVYRAEINS